MADPWETYSAPAVSGDPWERYQSKPDSTSGAGYAARFSAALAGNEADELARAQRYYPDAKRLDDGSIIFTDPNSKRATLFNPPGFDMGDLVDFAPAIAEGVGGAAGAAAGSALGPAGTLGGAALGTLAIRKALEAGQALIGAPETRALPERIIDDAQTALTGAGGEVAGQALGRVAGSLAKPASREILEAADRLGIPLTPGMVGREQVAGLEKTAEMLPLSPAQHFADRSKAALETTRQSLVGDAGGRNAGELELVAGRALKEGADRGYARFQTVRSRLDDAFYRAMPPDTPVRLDEVRNMRDKLRTRIAEAPETMGAQLKPALTQVERVLTDADQRGGAISVGAVRDIRTALGKMLDLPPGTEAVGGAAAELKSLYGALRTDLYDAARVSNPQAARLLDRHDRLVRGFRGSEDGQDSVAKSLDKIIRSGSDEAAFRLATTGSEKQLKTVLTRLNEPERNAVARAVWERLATTPQGTPSYTRLVREWTKMTPDRRQLLFGGVTDVRALDDFITVARAWNEREALTNWSGTARPLLTAGAATGAYLDPVSAASGYGGALAATAILDNPIAARMIATSPGWAAAGANDIGRIGGQESTRKIQGR
jgi:hypothetical protein